MLTGHIKRLSANLDNDTEAERLILQQQVFIYLGVVMMRCMRYDQGIN